MPRMSAERVRAHLNDVDLSRLNEVSLKTVGVSYLEMCIQGGMYGGSRPSAMDTVHMLRVWQCQKKVKHLERPKAFAEHANQLRMKPGNGVSRLHD